MTRDEYRLHLAWQRLWFHGRALPAAEGAGLSPFATAHDQMEVWLGRKFRRRLGIPRGMPVPAWALTRGELRMARRSLCAWRFGVSSRSLPDALRRLDERQERLSA